MALSAGESFSGGQVCDSRSRTVMISETANAALSAGEFYSGGFLRDPDGRMVICQDAAHSALSAGETLTGGDVRDAGGRIVCAAETVNTAISAGSQFSGGFLRDSRGRRIIAIDTLGAALVAGEQYSAGQVFDSAGRLVLASETAPFDPSTVANLAGWWKPETLAGADGDPISSWTDSSSSGLTATAAGAVRPTLKLAIVNGKSVARVAAGQRLAFSAGAMTDFSLFIVHNVTALVSYGGPFEWAPAAVAGFGIVSDVFGTWQPHIVRYNAAGAEVSNEKFTAGAAPPVGFFLNEVISAAGVQTAWQDASSQPVTAGAAGFGRSPGGSIGQGYGSTGFAGDIAEVIMYSRAVTTGERTSIENYIRGRYALW